MSDNANGPLAWRMLYHPPSAQRTKLGMTNPKAGSNVCFVQLIIWLVENPLVEIN